MTSHRRSLDDLPLAAYSTGTEPDPRLHALDSGTIASAGEPIDRAAMAALPLADGEPGPRAAGTPGRARGGVGRRMPSLPDWLANPRQNLRDPRLLFTGVIAVGVLLLVLSVLQGGASGGAGAADASPSAPAALAPTIAPVGNASVEVSGKLAASYALTGLTGSGPATEGQMQATWGDASGATLGLSGPAFRGTRTTDAGLVLTWTVPVDGVPVTFTSRAAECTIGMAASVKSVNGSFVCKKLRSDDGKLVVDARGSYRT